jgi:hypothetical protein
MEADPLPIGTRNHILCEVFDLLPEDDEDELPFRLDDDDEPGPNEKKSEYYREMNNA